jgi:hypothetical protein
MNITRVISHDSRETRISTDDLRFVRRRFRKVLQQKFLVTHERQLSDGNWHPSLPYEEWSDVQEAKE